MTNLMLPPNYIPRKNDVVLLLGRVRFDADLEDRRVHIELVGEEHVRAAVEIKSLAGVFNYGWKIGDRVRNVSDHSDIGSIIALHDRVAWVRHDTGSFLTYELNELEPGPPQTVRVPDGAASLKPDPCTGRCIRVPQGCNCGMIGYMPDGVRSFVRCLQGCSCLVPCCDSPTVKQEAK